MQPVGLTLKDVTTNPFTGRTSGELMIVHRCLQCGHISRNRIAGDDYPDAIMGLLSPTNTTDKHLLTTSDKVVVLIALFGYDYAKHWNK